MIKYKKGIFIILFVIFTGIFFSQITYAESSSDSVRIIGKVNITKLYNRKPREITLYWNKISGVSGYQIYRAQRKNGPFQRIKTVSAVNTVYTDKVSAGKTYYYKIRGFMKVGKTSYYGPFSKICGAKEIGTDWFKRILSTTAGQYYVQYQEDYNMQLKTVYRKDFTHYVTADLNNDGIKELILSISPSNKIYDNRVLVLAYYNNTVKPIICFSGNGARGHYYIRGKELIFVTGGSDFSYRVDYTVSKGKLKKIRDMRYYFDKYSGPTRRSYFWVNGKSVSESVWSNTWKKYNVDNLSEVKFNPIK